MTVDTVTGEIVTDDLTADQARTLTNDIKSSAERVYSLLLTAHERKAWAALGYHTWESYVRTEFDMSRGRSYQVLDQARVIKAIGDAAGVSTSVDITEAAS